MTLTKTAKNFKLGSKLLKLDFFLFMLRFFVVGSIKKQTTQKFIQYKRSHLKIIKSVLKIFWVRKPSILNFLNDMEMQKTIESFNTLFNKFLTLSPVIFTNFIKNLLSDND
jgi:hypothetical protein